ncbi:hypothetical protein [Patulibacter minatonensis]|uniref:hypothetical protein n=1 Tax=Patulibacter minatonensis TaxID=298163 RepID=UPI0004BC4570|nr:hypothetical protein [Patulibacter minatonensis]
MDLDRMTFDLEVHRMVGVLSVADECPGPGCVTLRVVAGHGDRIRRAAGAIAPADLVLHVLEDDLVTTVPQLPPDTAAQRRASGAPSGDRELRCSYVFCHHRPDAAAFGLQAGDRCRQKIRVTGGWLSCPGSYAPAPPPRRRWWRLGR